MLVVRQNRGMTPKRNPANDAAFPKNDRGSGSLDDYKFDLIPRSAKLRIQLAGSDPYQDELRTVLEENGSKVNTAGGQRTIEEERTDAPMELRLFTGRRVSGVVGTVPRGLEPAVAEALVRLERANKPLRIPAEIVTTRRGLRVELLMGQTRDL
jgi:hypothetical protein